MSGATLFDTPREIVACELKGRPRWRATRPDGLIVVWSLSHDIVAQFRHESDGRRWLLLRRPGDIRDENDVRELVRVLEIAIEAVRA